MNLKNLFICKSAVKLYCNVSISEYKELVKKSKKQTKSEKASCMVDQQEPNAEVVKPKKVTRENLLHTASKLSSGDSQSALEDCERLLSSYENNYSVDALQLFKGKEETLNLLKCEGKRSYKH